MTHGTVEEGDDPTAVSIDQTAGEQRRDQVEDGRGPPEARVGLGASGGCGRQYAGSAGQTDSARQGEGCLRIESQLLDSGGRSLRFDPTASRELRHDGHGH